MLRNMPKVEPGLEPIFVLAPTPNLLPLILCFPGSSGSVFLKQDTVVNRDSEGLEPANLSSNSGILIYEPWDREVFHFHICRVEVPSDLSRKTPYSAADGQSLCMCCSFSYSISCVMKGPH